MNFVAIDFETANEHRNSPCAVAVVVVKDGELADQRAWLIRPKELYSIRSMCGFTGSLKNTLPTNQISTAYGTPYYRSLLIVSFSPITPVLT